MQDIRIALVQANQVWENKEANFENYISLLKNVEADLILLPEMFQTGFSMNTEEMAESWGNSPSIEWLKTISQSKNCAIYTSLMITENDRFYNRGVFIYPDGTIKKYDKRKTFSLAGEGNFFESGNEETIVEYLGWRFQLQICYDLRFPEICRNYLLPNQTPAYDVLMYVANWPQKRINHWDSLLIARAIENQSFVLGVNRVGIDANSLQYSGNSSAINALGEVYTSEENNEKVILTLLKKDDLETVRKNLPFLQDC